MASGPQDDGDDDQEATVVRPTGQPAAPESVPSNGALAPGVLLSHTYRIEEHIARGGMGDVYRARHEELGTLHAVKMILPELVDNAKVVDLFRREAGVLRNVRHDGVVGYDGVFRDEHGRVFLVMEYAEGPSLSQVLNDGPLPPSAVRQLRDRLAAGLAAAHEAGVVHRDMSPDNVILPGGRADRAKIIDFGIAKLADADESTILGDDFAGKFSYVSPEQLGMFGGQVDARSDIYSLGLVLVAAAIGRPLKMGHSPSTVIEARRTVPDLARVPADLRDELTVMLEPDPARRVPSMRALLDGHPAARGRLPGRVIAMAGGVAVAMAAVLAAIVFWPSDDPDVATTPPVESVPAPADDPAVDEAEAVGAEAVGADAEPPVQRTRVVNPLTLRLQVDGILSRFDCAALSASVTSEMAVAVEGFVSSQADLRQLRTQLNAIDEITALSMPVAVQIWPFCAVVKVVDADGSASGQPGAPRIAPNNRSLVYTEGDSLIVRATATNRFDGYLYVDYIDNGGDVVHLFPTPRRPDNRVRAGEQVTLGVPKSRAEPGERFYVIGPPFGPNMILVTSSPVPLFDRQRAEAEKAADYVPALDAAMAAARGRGDGPAPVADYLFIDTVPQR